MGSCVGGLENRYTEKVVQRWGVVGEETVTKDGVTTTTVRYGSVPVAIFQCSRCSEIM